MQMDCAVDSKILIDDSIKRLDQLIKCHIARIYHGESTNGDDAISILDIFSDIKQSIALMSDVSSNHSAIVSLRSYLPPLIEAFLHRKTARYGINNIFNAILNTPLYSSFAYNYI